MGQKYNFRKTLQTNDSENCNDSNSGIFDESVFINFELISIINLNRKIVSISENNETVNLVLHHFVSIIPAFKYQLAYTQSCMEYFYWLSVLPNIYFKKYDSFVKKVLSSTFFDLRKIKRRRRRFQYFFFWYIFIFIYIITFIYNNNIMLSISFS